MDHSNLFHGALTKVRDIIKNGCRNQQAWHDVLEVVDAALEEARRLDRNVRDDELPILTPADANVVRGHLRQALRQWRMHAEDRGDRDLSKDDDMEAALYRELSATLNQTKSQTP